MSESPVNSWGDLIGYDSFLENNRQLIEAGKMPMVSIMTGPAGVGKSKLLRATIAQWLCQSSSACGHCSSCTQVMQGTHPDVLILEPIKANYKVDDAEKVREHLSIMPQGSRRIVGILEADAFLTHGVNRLLKTLEEPPSHGVVVLTTSRWDSLLPTLKSRCVHRRLPRLTAEQCWQVVCSKSDRAQEWSLADGIRLSERCRNAPGLVLQSLEEEEGSQLSKLVRELFMAKSTSGVLETAEKIASIADVAQLTHEAEVVLNELYRAGQEFSPKKMLARRNILNKSRTIAVRSRIAINTRLVAEGLGFADESWLDQND